MPGRRCCQGYPFGRRLDLLPTVLSRLAKDALRLILVTPWPPSQPPQSALLRRRHSSLACAILGSPPPHCASANLESRTEKFWHPRRSHAVATKMRSRDLISDE